jgi:hypothetical protein
MEALLARAGLQQGNQAAVTNVKPHRRKDQLMTQEVEYRVFQAGSAEDIGAKLNEAAQAGFRLVQAVQTGEGGIFVVMEGPMPATTTGGE